MEKDGIVMIEKYIVVKDKKIIGCFETSQGEAGIIKSMGDIKYDSMQKVDINGDHRIETHIDEYDGNKFKPLSMRVKAGHVKLPDGHKLDGETVVTMTIEDKVNAGLIELSPLMKAIGNDVIQKTDAELIVEGIKTQKQIDDEKLIIEEEKLIQAEMRKIAIEQLGNKLTKIKS